MKPILYEKSGADYTKNGIGVLSDVISGEVTTERNGAYECEFTYPVNGAFFSEIVPDKIIKVKANETSALQLFRIDRRSKEMDGKVKVYAKHISYDLNKLGVTPISKSSRNATAALTAILSNAVYNNTGFSVYSDITSSLSWGTDVPMSARACLGGVEGSILDVYGGEYEFDNFTIKLHSARGADNGVRIAYGKNLIDLSDDLDISTVYTALQPYVTDADGNIITLTEKILETSSVSSYGYHRVKTMDFTEFFGENETINESALRAKAYQYMNANPIDTPSQRFTIDFVPLYQTKEYESIANLERISLCDLVTVEHAPLGITVKAKCVKTVYDFVKERYKKIVLGNARSSFSKTLSKTETAAKAATDFQKAADSETRRISKEQTKKILGGSGGYVYAPTDSAGRASEIYFLDNPDPAQAVNVLRINYSGIGFSSTGINGTFTTAWTIDGKFNASYIMSGILNASLIKSGTLQDSSGTTSLDMTTGKFSVSQSTSNRRLDIYNSGISLVNTSNSTIIGGLWANPPKVSMPTGRFDDAFADNVSCETIKIYADLTSAQSGIASLNYSGGAIVSDTPVKVSKISVIDGNGIEKGYISYSSTSDKVTASIDRLYVKSELYTPLNITINGTTYSILARTV